MGRVVVLIVTIITKLVTLALPKATHLRLSIFLAQSKQEPELIKLSYDAYLGIIFQPTD